MPGPAGYMGPLRGMFFDPIRGKYFPDRPSGSGSGFESASVPIRAPTLALNNSPSEGLSTRGQRQTDTSTSGRNNRRPRIQPVVSEPAITDPTTSESVGGRRSEGSRIRPRGRGAVQLNRTVASPAAHRDRQERDVYSNLASESVEEVADNGDSFTSIQSVRDGAYLATTAMGSWIMQESDMRLPSQVMRCSGRLVGTHFDIARMQYLIVSSGEHPHLHHIKHDVDNRHGSDDVLGATPLSRDVYCMSSFDAFCSLGATNSLITVRFDTNVRTVYRPLPSDALAIHHHSHDDRFIGLRNSQLVRADLRAPPHSLDVIASMQRGKAVVGIKRLNDAVVPFGLLASGMSNELVIFDIRFAKAPLRSLPGHINAYHSDLGLATTPDDKFLFAAGSDHRIRAWSLWDGERLHPDQDRELVSSTSSNPLTRVFKDRPTAISITDQGVMNVGVGHCIHRFQPGSHRSSGRVDDFQSWEDLDSFM